MLIRDACLADAERVVMLHHAAVHAGAQREYSRKVLDAWSPPPDERRFAWMRGQIAAGKNRVLVAELPDGSVAGFCIFGAPDGFVHAVYVAPDSAGGGIGRQLLLAAEREISAASVSEARLNASLNAVAFYRAAGYAVVRPAQQVLGDGAQMDCMEMLKELSPVQMKQTPRIADLPSLGPKSSAMLARAGITTVEQLGALGSVRAYVLTKRACGNVSLNLLWALESALCGEPWQEVARRHRTSLLLALDQCEREASADG